MEGYKYGKIKTTTFDDNLENQIEDEWEDTKSCSTNIGKKGAFFEALWRHFR